MKAPTLRASLTYAAGYRLIEALIFSPLLGAVGQALRGGLVVDSTALVGFFLSPRGLGAILITGTSLLLIRMMEQAGLAALLAGDYGGAALGPGAAFRLVLSRFIPLLRAAGRFIAVVAAALAPVLLAAGIAARHFLSRHDINYYLDSPTGGFLAGVSAVAVVGLACASFLLWRVVRWRWVVHAIVLEDAGPGQAFRRSGEIARGIAWRTALLWGAVALFNLALGLLAAWVGRLVLPLGAGLLGHSLRSLGVLLGGLIVFQALLGASILLICPVLESRVFTKIYFDRAGRARSSRRTALRGPLLRPGVLAAAALLLVLLGGAAGGLWGTRALSVERPVKVIAHRAAVGSVPENSLPAIERAIQDGADVAEIDVQLSRDGVIVLAHDSDFSRTAGVAKKVSDLTWKEISAIDLGAGMDPEFAGTRVPRLEAVLDAAKGRIPLNIELKHYGEGHGELEAAVVELLRRRGELSGVEIQSLEHEALMRVRREAPEAAVGYLMSVNVKEAARLEVDFLSVQAARVTPRFLRRARRRGQKVYVWTVDKPEDMERYLDLGVDGLITNQSKVAAELVRRRQALSENERALRRLQSWLAR